MRVGQVIDEGKKMAVLLEVENPQRVDPVRQMPLTLAAI